MGSLNKVMLIGNLGRDPEVRTAESGTCICQLRLATHERRANDGDKPDVQTEWHNVVAFGKLAEVSRDYLKKGRRIYVEGRLRTRSYQKENGPTQWYTEIVASDIQFLDPSAPNPSEVKGNVDAEF